jgi:hypothetical protein
MSSGCDVLLWVDRAARRLGAMNGAAARRGQETRPLEDEIMVLKSTAVVLAIQLGLAACLVAALGAATAQAQALNVPSIAIKSGETLELGPVYFVQTCRSIMLAKPEAEILEGPPGVTVTVKEGDVVPRSLGCANKVKGGTLFLTAPQQIEDDGVARLVVRVNFKTKDGDRKQSLIVNLSLIP